MDKLDGAAEGKERLKTILATMTGEVRWLEACDLTRRTVDGYGFKMR